MRKNILNKIIAKPLKIIKLPSGNVMHVLKKNDYKNWIFGEAYFSKIKFGKIKAWKYHLKMTLNLVVPHGKVKFVFYSEKLKRFKIVEIGEKKYSRLTVPPKVWFGFKGISKNESTILNLANVQHNPKEVLARNLKDIKFNW
jgi:dTDP-4-dehydrorhamnose 3,5-epimerase